MVLICFVIRPKKHGGFGMPSKIFLYIVIALIIIISRFETIGVVFRSLNTLIHELGHAIIAIILGGKVGKIKLNDNASGSCSTSSKGSFKSFLIASAGYLFCAIFSYFIFYSIGKTWNQYIFWAFLIISCISLIFWIRNTYGIIWTIAFASINFGLILIPNAIINYSNYILLILGLLIGLENIFGCLILLKISIFDSKKAGDATNMAKLTKIPAFVWASGFLAFSIWMSYISFKEFYPLFQ